MKRIVIILCAMVLVIVSCKESKTERENLPIKKDVMIKIIYDIQKAKAIVAITKDSTQSNESRLQSFNYDILRKHNTTQSAFDSTWNYYFANPTQMDSLLKKVSNLESEI
jgi:hypothetical protein